MAEFVELRLEEMIPELEQMQRVNLFSGDEIKAIVKKRRELEYKLQKRTKNKGDYLNYIQYEITLLSLLRVRRKKIGYQHKKPEIDYAVAHRINKLFTYATARFPSDVTLWLSHIEFCKRMKWNSSISRIFVHLLAVKGDDPALWIRAAKWEFEDNSSVANARSLLLRALRHHPGSVRVYTEAFRLELLEADRLRKRRSVLGLSCESDLPEEQDKRDSILEGQLAVLFYDDCTKKATSASDLVPFLAVAKEFDFTADIQKRIFEDMKKDFGQDEMTWDAVARNHLEKDRNGPSLKLKQRIKTCCEYYEEALVQLNTTKMWQLYVDTVFELHANEAVRPFVQGRLNDVCQRALAAGKLSEKQLLDWVVVLERNPVGASIVKETLQQSVKQFDQNATLWIKYLKSLLVAEDELFTIDDGRPQEEESKPVSVPAEFLSEFWRAVQRLGDTEAAVGVWETVIGHYVEAGQQEPGLIETVQDLYAKALAREPPVASHLKPRILTWTAATRGLDECRRFYSEHADLPPMVLDFHLRMIQLELEQDCPDVKRVRKAFETACQSFGNGDPEVWMHYIRFELENAAGDANRVAQLHYRAKLSLNAGAVDQFLEQYTLLQLQA